MKYAGYISKEQEMADKLSRFEDITIPEDFPYDKLGGISSEARQKSCPGSETTDDSCVRSRLDAMR